MQHPAGRSDRDLSRSSQVFGLAGTAALQRVPFPGYFNWGSRCEKRHVARVTPQAKNCYRTNFLKTARGVESKPTLNEAAELLRDLEMAVANANRAARRFPRAAFTGVSGSVVSISQAGPAAMTGSVNPSRQGGIKRTLGAKRQS
jgi:hypothetical protein